VGVVSEGENTDGRQGGEVNKQVGNNNVKSGLLEKVSGKISNTIGGPSWNWGERKKKRRGKKKV